MTNICPMCGGISLTPITQEANKHYFLCTVDTGVQPPNIDLGTGMPVDTFGCIKCGTIFLNSQAIIQK